MPRLSEIKKIEKRENELLKTRLEDGDFYFSEFDSEELNDLQNRKVKYYLKKWKKVFLYNLKGEMKEYKGGKLLNFSFDFGLRKRSKKLELLLRKYNSKDIKLSEISKLIGKIFKLVEEEGGFFLYWS